MSAHILCTCGTRKNWRVLHRNHNHSYFEQPKGGRHYSDYSEIICLRCPLCFRTKAKYVSDIPDFGKGERRPNE